MDWENPSRVALTLAKLFYNVALLALLAAVYTAVLFRSRPAAFAAIGFLVLRGAGHLAIGIVGYRRTMSKPWPKVPPLDDDDE